MACSPDTYPDGVISGPRNGVTWDTGVQKGAESGVTLDLHLPI